VARRPRAPSCGSRNQISGIDSSARRARCCRRSELIVHHGAENVTGNHLKGRYRRGRSGVTSMRLSLWIGFGHLTWIKFEAATYELSCWLLRGSIKRNGKSGGWYRSRLIWAGNRRRPRYCRNVRQVAPQHHRNSAIHDRYSCPGYWMAVGADAQAPLRRPSGLRLPLGILG